MPDLTYEEYANYFDNSGLMIPKLRAEIPLYRYRNNIDYIVDEIKNEHIFLSDLDSLNDPFDSSYAFSLDEAIVEEFPFEYLWKTCYFLMDYDWYKSFESFSDIENTEKITLKDFSLLVEKIAKRHGNTYPAMAVRKNYWKLCNSRISRRKILGRVACFSERWNSIPMWSYYADSHRGCCFKYDLDLLDTNDVVQMNIRNSIYKVWYSNKRFTDGQGSFSPFMKDESWSHEQEWRIFREYGHEFLFFPCLSEIYLGIDFDPEKIDSIIEAIKYTAKSIKIFILHPCQEEYGFIKIPLRFT